MSALALSSVDDHDELRRRVLWLVPTVLAVLGTVADDGTGHLMSISWITPAANEPTRLVASVETSSRSAALLEQTGVWSLSLLSTQQRDSARRFVKPTLRWINDDTGEYAQEHAVQRSSLGAPFLSDATAVMAGTAARLVIAGDHELWMLSVGEVGARDDVLAAPASQRVVAILGVHDTRMNYGR